MRRVALFNRHGIVVWSGYKEPGITVSSVVGTNCWQHAVESSVIEREFALALLHQHQRSVAFTLPDGSLYNGTLQGMQGVEVVGTWEPVIEGVFLTDREKQVLRLLCKDMTTREIAKRVGVSMSTVESHLAHIRKKLRVRGNVGAALAAQRLGIVD